jgi:hypothetical protein
MGPTQNEIIRELGTGETNRRQKARATKVQVGVYFRKVTADDIAKDAAFAS